MGRSLQSLCMVVLSCLCLRSEASRLVEADAILSRSNSVEFLDATTNLSFSVADPSNVSISYLWELWNVSSFDLSVTNGIYGSSSSVPFSINPFQSIALRWAPDTNLWIQFNKERDPIWILASNSVLQHTESDHGVTTEYGFYGGGFSSAVKGGAIGAQSETLGGGAVGKLTKTTSGFAGGSNALCTVDGSWTNDGIDAVQLGTGANTNPLSLQVYSFPIVDSNGVIPLTRFPFTMMTNVSGVVTQITIP